MSSPTIISSSIIDNDYMIITFNEAVYTNSAHNLPVAVADFVIVLGGSGTGASAVSIASVKKTDGTALSSTGGESAIRVNLTWTGSCNGNETVEITPASGTSIYNSAGEAMSDSETTGAVVSIGIPSVIPIVGTDTYVTVYDADVFFSKRLNTTVWDSSSDADKAKALIMATQNIDTLRFKGTKYDLTQTLQFPRTYHSFIYGGGIADSGIPEDVKKAVCLEAQELLSGTSNTSRATLQAQGVKKVSIGNVSEEYSGNISATSNSEALSLLKKYLVSIVPVI